MKKTILPLLVVLSGCSVFPQQSIQECVDDYPNDEDTRIKCIEETTMESNIRQKREDLKREKAECQLPRIWNGHWCE